jgi:hypothetical protein
MPDNSNPNVEPHPRLRSIINNYQRNIDTNDTKSVWFSAADIRALLALDDVNGIRIYFARHEESDPHHPNKKTVVIIPTIDKSFPVDPQPESSKDAPDKGILTTANFQTSNGGALCPPRCS